MIKIICLGKLKTTYLKDMVNDYLKRIKKYHKIEIIELKDNENILKESEDVLKHIKPQEYIIAMDINGIKTNSIDFSNIISNTFNHFGTITFIIGSSNGLSRDVKNKANILLSFSDNTFPHGLFRAMLLEQIYRSFKIINNENYHK